MSLPPNYNDIIIKPDSSPVTALIPCADCGENILTAFGYANVASTLAEPKPTVYFADWVPTPVDKGITLIVGRGEFSEDEATNRCAIAFSLTPYKDGLNIELVDASQTVFAEGLRHVFSVMSSVADAKKNPELNLCHSIAIKVLSDDPRLKSFLMQFSEVLN